MTELYCLAIALLTSVIGAISGLGGGVIIKPALEWLTDMDIAAISFLSTCTVLAMVAVALCRQWGKVEFDPERGTPCAMGAMIGGVFGKLIFDLVRGNFGGETLGLYQSALMMLMMIGLLIYMAVRGKIGHRDIRGRVPALLLGAGMGILASFLGIGGGPLNVAMLMYCFGMDNKRAALHSIYIALFSQGMNLVMTFARGTVPQVSVSALLLAMLGGVLGAAFGSSLSRRMQNRAVGRVYVVVLIFVLCLATRNLLMYM